MGIGIISVLGGGGWPGGWEEKRGQGIRASWDF